MYRPTLLSTAGRGRTSRDLTTWAQLRRSIDAERLGQRRPSCRSRAGAAAPSGVQAVLAGAASLTRESPAVRSATRTSRRSDSRDNRRSPRMPRTWGMRSSRSVPIAWCSVSANSRSASAFDSLFLAALVAEPRERVSPQQGRPTATRVLPNTGSSERRQPALSRDAEDGTGTPMLMARSGHTSVRPLAKYARVSAEAPQRHQGRTPTRAAGGRKPLRAASRARRTAREPAHATRRVASRRWTPASLTGPRRRLRPASRHRAELERQLGYFSREDLKSCIRRAAS